YKGTPLDEMPALAEEYEHVMPEYKTLPGWNETTYGLKDGAKLPRAAVDYLRFISDFLQVEIGMISTGPERDATIVPAGTLLACGMRWGWCSHRKFGRTANIRHLTARHAMGTRFVRKRPGQAHN